MRKSIAVVFLVTVDAFSTLSAFGQPVTVPEGVMVGGQYRLIFVTSQTTQATSSSLGYYNNFVTTDANTVPALAALGTEWTAVASTTGEAAYNTNTVPTSTGVPIYGLGGEEIAANNAAFWSSSHQSPINTTEIGTTYSGAVWTGTADTGTPASFDGIIPAGLGATPPSRALITISPPSDQLRLRNSEIGYTPKTISILPTWEDSQESTSTPTPTLSTQSRASLLLTLQLPRADQRRSVVSVPISAKLRSPPPAPSAAAMRLRLRWLNSPSFPAPRPPAASTLTYPTLTPFSSGHWSSAGNSPTAWPR